MIADFDRRGGWKAGGHKNCVKWLAFRTGLSEEGCRERVRAARALIHLPQISESMARGELSFSKVKALTRVATPENESALLEVAQRSTARQLERLTRSLRTMSAKDEAEREKLLHASRTLAIVPDNAGMYRISGTLDPEVGALLMRAIEAASDALYARAARDDTGAAVTPEQRRADALGLLAERALGAGLIEDAVTSGTRAERYQVMLHVTADTLESHDSSDDQEAPEMSELSDGTRVCAQTARRVGCDAGLVQITKDGAGKILDVGRRTRTIPPAIRRALDVRDGGCRFPGCGLRFTSAHHIVHWADGGETKLDNLILLCRHHHRLVHEEGWRVEALPGEAAVFTSPTGDVMRRAPKPAPELSPEPVQELVASHADLGITPDWKTASCEWEREGQIDEVLWLRAFDAGGG